FVFRSKKPFDPKRFWDYVQHKFPSTIIRSKGLFWLASRPEQALVWSQAGGSLRADSAGVWWSSMPYEKRSRYLSFNENQKQIESEWDRNFGDRKNEIVFIGENMDEERIITELNSCLTTASQLASQEWKQGYDDEWPVQRAYALE
ncbi:MAG: GTP-binding protein, partial [Bacteroidota bacterium]